MSNYDSFGVLSVVAFFALLLLVGGYNAAGAFANEHDEICTVTSMDRGADSKGNSNYRVYTQECGVLANQDSWLRGKVDSADVWGRIHQGQQYKFRVVGFRFGLFSTFPNILSAEAVIPAGDGVVHAKAAL